VNPTTKTAHSMTAITRARTHLPASLISNRLVRTRL